MNDPTKNITAFYGLRNRAKNRANIEGSLSSVLNMDVDDEQGLLTRKGYRKSMNGQGLINSFCTQDEKRLFIVQQGGLYLIDEGFNKELIYSGLGDEYIYWAEQADYIVLSNGLVIDPQNRVMTWIIEEPSQPLVTITAGSLPKGTYRIVTTLYDETGREGGASIPVQINLNEDEGLRIQPFAKEGFLVRTYVTDTDGSVYYLSSIEQVEFSIVQFNAFTSPLDDNQLKGQSIGDDEPVGTIAFFENKLWVSKYTEGLTAIFNSFPFWWNLFDIHSQYVMVEGRVNAIKGVKEGLIIATDDRIYIYNESLVKLADYGVPQGIPYVVDDDDKLYLWTHQGLCGMMPFVNMTEGKVVVDSGQTCHVEIVNQDGFKKIVVLVNTDGITDNPRLEYLTKP